MIPDIKTTMMILSMVIMMIIIIVMGIQRHKGQTKKDMEKFELIFNTSPDGTLITRLSDGVIVKVNDGFFELSGATRDEVIGKTTLEYHFWYNVADRDIYTSMLKEKGFCKNMEFKLVRKDGSIIIGLISGRTITINNQIHIYSVVRDISDRKAIEAALVESEGTYRSILEASPDDITITDMAGNILMVSNAAKNMFGYEMDFDGFRGMKFKDFIVEEDLERAISNIRLMFRESYLKPNEYTGKRKDGSTFDIEVNSGLVRDIHGKPTKMIIIVRDISQRKQAEMQIQSLVKQLKIERDLAQFNSITDSLTNLANRRYFDDVFNKEFSRIKRTGDFLSLIMIDVDHFKKYNDIHGHLAGDECLRQIGIILKETVSRTSDTVARFGGEEFVVVLPKTDKQGAHSLAERIRRMVESLEIPNPHSNIIEQVTISLGVVTVKPEEVSGPEEVLLLVDKAMYQAKENGRNNVVFFDRIRRIS